MPVPLLPRRLCAGVAMAAALAVSAGCGDSGDDDTPDEVNFCRLALVNEPVAEADASVLRRLDELAPEEIDASIVILREASEELEDLSPRSPDAIALEFEIRFRPDHIDARNEVEAFIESECVAPTTTTADDKDDGKVETELPSGEPEQPTDDSVPPDSVGPSDDG